MKKAAGVVLLSLPFIITGFLAVESIGLLMTFAVFGLAVGTVAVLALGVFLMVD